MIVRVMLLDTRLEWMKLTCWDCFNVIYVFLTLYHRKTRYVLSDEDNLTIKRRMNLDVIWSREPSTMENNLRMMSLLISTCETSGFDPQFPRLVPFPFEYVSDFTVAFSMLIHSILPGIH